MASAPRVDGIAGRMNADDELLRGVLGTLGIEARAAVWTPLDGGLSNSSYKVDLEHDSLVVRLRDREAEFRLDLAAEAALLRAVALSGLGPPPVGIDVERQALVTRHVSASAWSPEAARDEINIARAAALLHALHGLDVPCRAFAPQRYATRYIEAASMRRGKHRADRALATELLDLARGFERRYRPTALCHNDLVAANILDSGELALIDFEYAVCADPLVDLASLAAMNDYGAGERRILLDAYREAGGPRYRDRELEEAMRLTRLMTYFWALGADDARAEVGARFADRSKL